MKATGRNSLVARGIRLRPETEHTSYEQYQPQASRETASADLLAHDYFTLTLAVPVLFATPLPVAANLMVNFAPFFAVLLTVTLKAAVLELPAPIEPSFAHLDPIFEVAQTLMYVAVASPMFFT